MHKDLIVKTKTLGGKGDLTLLTRIKPGLAPSLESISYKTRCQRMLQTLHTGRTNSHEAALLRPFADAVDRVGKIHAVRVAVVEPDRLLLSVTFDGGWESYVRVLWQKVGTLLDLIFSGTEDYVLSTGRFEDWAEWIYRVQIETNFYYAMPGLTVDDVLYLRKDEALRQVPGLAPPAEALKALRARNESAEQIAWSLQGRGDPRILMETGRQALRALVSLHRLTSYFIPGTEDGEVLRRAARDLLPEILTLNRLGVLEDLKKGGRIRFDEQIDWLLTETPRRVVPALPASAPKPADLVTVQAGIVAAYPETVSHGSLVLLGFRNAAAAAGLLKNLLPRMQFEGGAGPAAGEPFISLSFSFDGLRMAGLSEAELALFPLEFQQGMASRAGLLGDLRGNHPAHWRLPLRNWPGPVDAHTAAGLAKTVELSAVHAIVQLRIASHLGPEVWDIHDAAHPLRPAVSALAALAGVEVLAVEPMVRLRYPPKDAAAQPRGEVREHFGFVDGAGQPVLDPAQNGKLYRNNLVHLGEVLQGHANEAEDYAPPASALTPEQFKLRDGWLKNGSFLVVRKLRQDVAALDAAVDQAARETGLNGELIRAKMMGRWRGGQPLVGTIGPGGSNDFDFENDPGGAQCPIHSHIRRANPRAVDPVLPALPPGKRTPRLMRRGMSFGPLYEPANPATLNEPRGLMFMAYNASPAEQFEVVQRWLNGGNSSGGFSGRGDPFFGIPENGSARHYRFEHEGSVHRMRVDGADAPLTDARPLVRLDWGAYLFTPARPALEKLRDCADSQAKAAVKPAWNVDLGERLIKAAQERVKAAPCAHVATEVWKQLLEDPAAREDYTSASIWAAIRKHHGGVLDTHTRYGALVADRALMNQVLHPDEPFSVSGYMDRMKDSVGPIYLGMDDDGSPGCPYNAESQATNAAIGRITQTAAFELARKSATELIEARVAFEHMGSRALCDPHWELSLTAREVFDAVLEALCQHWFGLPKAGGELVRGGARWDWRKPPRQPDEAPSYPGHFTAPSRLFFQPEPFDPVPEYGKAYGDALRAAMNLLVKRHKKDGNLPQKPGGGDAPVAQAIFNDAPHNADPDWIARTMVGAIMGFAPTLDGNLQLTLHEWLRDGRFWSLRNRWAAELGRGAAVDLALAQRLLGNELMQTMMLRPSPELIWRTATRDTKLGTLKLKKGEKVVLSIVSATQQSLAAGKVDIWPVFGGHRGQNTTSPTHACPGYEAAMGVLLGTFTALVETRHPIRPSIAPLAFSFEGELSPAEMPPECAPKPARQLVDVRVGARLWRVGAAVLRPQRQPLEGLGKRLFVVGDAWLAYQAGGAAQNLAAYLAARHGYEIQGMPSSGTLLAGLAAPAGIAAQCAMVERLILEGRRPDAILLSAGGNDVAKDNLVKLLNKADPALPVLNPAAVQAVVATAMAGQLTAILSAYAAACRRADGKPIPVFLHGYAYPVPDGRWLGGVPGTPNAWLFPGLRKMGHADPAACTLAMKALIDALNAMQGAAAAMAATAGAHVHHIALTSLLSNQAGAYVADWDNELNPSESGFIRISDAFAARLAAVLA